MHGTRAMRTNSETGSCACQNHGDDASPVCVRNGEQKRVPGVVAWWTCDSDRSQRFEGFHEIQGRCPRERGRENGGGDGGREEEGRWGERKRFHEEEESARNHCAPCHQKRYEVLMKKQEGKKKKQKRRTLMVVDNCCETFASNLILRSFMDTVLVKEMWAGARGNGNEESSVKFIKCLPWRVYTKRKIWQKQRKRFKALQICIKSMKVQVAGCEIRRPCGFTCASMLLEPKNIQVEGLLRLSNRWSELSCKS